MATWRAEEPDNSSWRCAPDLDRAERGREQDMAAGGRQQRVIMIGDRAVLASVALRRKSDGRRIYAYLRWSDQGKTSELYIGEVTEPTRAANLALAWRLAAEHSSEDERDRSDGIAVKPDTSWASSPAVLAVMRANKGKDTRPELAV